MNLPYYQLPLDIRHFLQEGGGTFEHCSELESVDRFLGMLLMTFPGEHAFDEEFGTRIWEMDFENITLRHKWEEQFIGYIRQAVETSEKRLGEIEVRINLRDVLRGEGIDTVTVRKQVDIYISGRLKSTETKHTFKHTLYMGPISNQ